MELDQILIKQYLSNLMVHIYVDTVQFCGGLSHIRSIVSVLTHPIKEAMLDLKTFMF